MIDREFRITPACAGRTRFRFWRLVQAWDHPRMCGKDSILFLAFSASLGSPPHVREGLKSKFTDHMKNGITPACAGRT